MRALIKCMCSFGFGVAALAFLPLAGFGQMNDLRVALVIENETVPEHLPIAFNAVIKSESSREVEVLPYDLNRLPDTVLSIKIESPLALPPATPKINDLGSESIKIAPGGSISLKGYMQNYMRYLPPGTYKIPYHLRWEYILTTGAEPEARRVYEAQGQLQFRITNADSTSLDEYISTRAAILQTSSDIQKLRSAAEEISLIDAPAVLPALMILKDKGYEVEALRAGARLPDPEALKIFVAIASSSRNPAIIRNAIEEIEKRGGRLPDDTVRKLLESDNKSVQMEGLGQAKRTASPQLISCVNALLQSSDPDVRRAAERTLGEIRRASPR